VCGVSKKRLGPSYVFIPLVLGPLNSLKTRKTSRGYGLRILCGVKVQGLGDDPSHD
jgi:hypothetical protein